MSSPFPSCRRILGRRDNLKEKKSPKVFSSSPLASNENVSFPNELSAIKVPTAPVTTCMTARRKFTVSATSVVEEKSKEPKNKKMKAKRKSDNRNDSSEGEEDLSNSPHSFQIPVKEPSREQRRSLSGKRFPDKKGQKDFQFQSFENSSVSRTKAAGMGRMWPNDSDARRDYSSTSSFFHTIKRVRRVEQLVTMERQSSSESFDRTNPFSNVATGRGRGAKRRARGGTTTWRAVVL